MAAEVTAAELAAAIGGELSGNGAIKLSGISDLNNAANTDVSFILSKKYAKTAEASPARVIISDTMKEIPGKTIIFAKSARQAYIKAIHFFYPEKSLKGEISARASVSKTAKTGNNVFIDDYAVIKDGATIGDNTFIGAGVFVGPNCVIGGNSKIYPNVSTVARARLTWRRRWRDSSSKPKRSPKRPATASSPWSGCCLR